MLRLFIIANLIFFSVSALAEVENVNHSLIFQVIQDEFVLDNSTIKSAAIIEDKDGIYKGLNIVLKPESSVVFSEVSKAGIGKHLNLISNNTVVISTVIQTPLSNNFLVSGITKKDAQAFLSALNANKS